jgi:tetratricopeptide (TPR) repeat protein
VVTSPKVFCSHRSVDKDRVEEIARTLRERGIDAWLDAWEILPGDSIVGKINTGLENADVFLLFLSKTALDSNWVTTESHAATWARIEGHQRLIPVMLDPDAPVPALLSHLLRVDAGDIERLIAGILRITGKPALGPLILTQEKTFRITLRAPAPGKIAILAEVNGQPIAPEQEGTLGADFVFSYKDFLQSSVPFARQSPAAAAQELREAELARLGQAVGRVVFPGPIGDALATLLDDARSRNEPVLLSYETADPNLLSIPFEAARLPDGRIPALEPGVRVLRRYTEAKARAIEPRPGPLRILVAIGAPDEGKTKSTVLDIEAELQTILDAVDEARRTGGGAEAEILEVGNPEQIRDALLEGTFHVLHLSGHGNAGTIEMETEDGAPVSVTPKNLADAFRAAGQTPPLVVLSSCHGGVSGNDTASFAQGLLEQGVPTVLAMQSTVSDWYGTRLAGALYGYLGRKNVRLPSHALALARQEVESERRKAFQTGKQGGQLLPEYATPSLFCAGEEIPLLDWEAVPVETARKTQPPVAGPVPLLKIGELIGRREELREVLRILRDDPKAIEKHGRKAGVVLQGLGGVGKSALAGRTMSRLVEEDWSLAVVEGRWTLSELAPRVGAALLMDRDATIRTIAAQLLHPELPDQARVQLLANLLSSYSVLLVFDNFEDNLTLGGTAFLDAATGAVLGALYQSAHEGRILVTSRYPIPDSESWLATVPLGPLTPAQTRKLFYRLAELKGRPPEVLASLLRVIGGHPRMLEYLDAILRKGKGRLPFVEKKLRAKAADLGLSVEDLGGDLDQALQDAIRIGAQDILLDELLAFVVTDSEERETLEQASVFPMPIDIHDLARALSGTEDADPERIERVRRIARKLVRTSLLTPLKEDSVWVHRWTAETLKQRTDPAVFKEHCRRAGEFLFWRVGTASLIDAIEVVRLLLQAEAYDRAVEEAAVIYEFMKRYGQPAAIVAFMGEILEKLPESHDQYPVFLGMEADALWIIGKVRTGVEKMRRVSQILEQRVREEPTRADYQRTLSASYDRMGDLLKALGQGEQTRQFYESALLISERLASEKPNSTDCQRNLSVSYNKLGDLLQAFGQEEQARQLYDNALLIRERLAREEPNRADYQRDLSVSYERMGDLLMAVGQGEQARQFFENSLLIRERLARDEPNRADYQRDLSGSYDRMGDLLKALGQGEQARQFFENSLLIRERLARDEPNRADYQRNLSVSYNKLGDLLKALGQEEQARQFFEKDLLIAERLAIEEPDRADYQGDLVISFIRVAEFESKNGEAHLRRALAILESLKARGALLPTQEQWIGIIQGQLESPSPTDGE